MARRPWEQWMMCWRTCWKNKNAGAHEEWGEPVPTTEDDTGHSVSGF